MQICLAALPGKIVTPAGATACGWRIGVWRLARRVPLLLLIFALPIVPLAHAGRLADIWQGIRWGDASHALRDRFGARAIGLARPIDFGDSYADMVLKQIVVGGIPLIGFMQMDKSTGGLKRTQLERQRHGVNLQAFRAVLAGLEAEFGPPDAACGAWPTPAGGYQAAAARVWQRGEVAIRVIFRDTTIEAFEGCLEAGGGACGLTGQLVLRTSPPAGLPGGDGAGCPAPPAAGAHPR
jgi:hypothetical protein